MIDYNGTDFTKVVHDCDAVFETVGGDVATRSFAVLAGDVPPSSPKVHRRPPSAATSRHSGRRSSCPGAARTHCRASSYRRRPPAADHGLFSLSDAAGLKAVSEARHLKASWCSSCADGPYAASAGFSTIRTAVSAGFLRAGRTPAVRKRHDRSPTGRTEIGSEDSCPIARRALRVDRVRIERVGADRCARAKPGRQPATWCGGWYP